MRGRLAMVEGREEGVCLEILPARAFSHARKKTLFVFRVGIQHPRASARPPHPPNASPVTNTSEISCRATGSDVAELINSYIKEGAIVPVEITVGLIEKVLAGTLLTRPSYPPVGSHQELCRRCPPYPSLFLFCCSHPRKRPPSPFFSSSAVPTLPTKSRL